MTVRSVAIGFLASLCAANAFAQVDPDAPRGRLPDVAKPSAYRLDVTLLPDQARFSGHVEIGVALQSGVQRLYMHGKDLHVAQVYAEVGGRKVTASWREVDPTGVARLDFAQRIPAGNATLVFDYDAAYRNNPTGLYHVKVGDRWYAWNHFESTDARAAFPSFDQPGDKAPFTISIATRPGEAAISNAPQVSVMRKGEFDVHRFQTTKPLPTYLVALYAGPFARRDALIPADAQRATPLPLGAAAPQTEADKLQFVMEQTPPIVKQLEAYFGEAFPFPKLDQVATAELPGAMENAGADLYLDFVIALGPDAPDSQKKIFGEIVAHELSHQWFGDLVTPAWWDDLWLNESFANWMGYRIGDAWNPQLHIGVLGKEAGFRAMDTDALEVGRAIHQPILENSEIEDAFDNITYDKGSQVIGMIAAFMGDDAFRSGVRLHLSRHRYGNADSAAFFQALADAGHDPRIVDAMRSFVDQPGVPLVTFTRDGEGLVARQSRYGFLGSTPKPEKWIVPLCVRVDAQRTCRLMDGETLAVAAPSGAVVMPNIGGAGYYRFDLPEHEWDALISALPSLSAGEALAADDSLWASFRAGRAPARRLVTEARSLLANPDSDASLIAGQHFAGLRNRGLIEAAALPDYRRMMSSLYAGPLAAMGFDPGAGVYAKDSSERQARRLALVDLVANEAEEQATVDKLTAATSKYLAGDKAALDPALLETAFTVYVRAGGQPAAARLMDRALQSDDALFRRAALSSISGAGRVDVASWLFSFEDPRLQSTERWELLANLATTAGTSDLAGQWILDHFTQLSSQFGGIIQAGMSSSFSLQCSTARADQIDQVLGPALRKSSGKLYFLRTLEKIRHCSDLKASRSADLANALHEAT